jgi:hypothetical protein
MSHKRERLSLKGRKAFKGTKKGYPQVLGGNEPEDRCPNGSMLTGACPTITGFDALVQPPSLDFTRASSLPTGTQHLTGIGYLFGLESGTGSDVAPKLVTNNKQRTYQYHSEGLTAVDYSICNTTCSFQNPRLLIYNHTITSRHMM